MVYAGLALSFSAAAKVDFPAPGSPHNTHNPIGQILSRALIADALFQQCACAGKDDWHFCGLLNLLGHAYTARGTGLSLW